MDRKISLPGIFQTCPRVVALVLSLLLLTLAFSPLTLGPMGGARGETMTKNLAKDQYWPYQFKAKATDTLKVTARESNGRIFDLFLMKDFMFEKYEEALAENGVIEYVEDHSRLATHNMSYSKVMPNPGGTYIILIDNTEAPDESAGGSYANASLNLTLIVELEEASPGVGLVLAGLVLLATGALMAVRRRPA